MPNLLFLSQRLPYPPSKGEKIRAFHELKYLAGHYDIHLGCLVDDPADLDHVDALRPWCRDIHAVPIDPRRARIASLRGLLTGEGLSVTFFQDKGLCDWVRRVVRDIRPEVTFVYSSNMAPYILDLPVTGARIVDLVDVDSEKWRALGRTARGPMRFIYQREWRKIAALEGRIAAECDRAVLVSDAEAALFASHHSACADRIEGISNGVDARYFDPTAIDAGPAAEPCFVFTGTMDYPPNADAVAWFATAILPLIRNALPDARFTVVGANPSAAVRKLAALPGVTVTGRVPDVRPYLAAATAVVAPMRIARGIQNKVLEAMAMARPVVLTAGALEGIHAVQGREVALADTETAFAAACVQIARQGDAGMGQAARNRVLRDYDWDACLSRYDDMILPRPALAEPV